jgi:PD-(D/E)XK endonuclease
MEWLGSVGADIYIPLGHSPDCDLVADLLGRLLRVQVKTSTSFHKRRWVVALCTRGGNQSWNGIVKRMDPSRCDYLFVHVGDGRRWFIPSSSISGGTAICLGGPKYAEYEVAPGLEIGAQRELNPALQSSLP